MNRELKNLELIVAIGKNREIGYNGNLIWRIKEDLDFFKRTTMDSYIIMGKKTYESMPKSLKGRKYIVLSRNRELELLPSQILCNDLESTLNLVEDLKNSRFLVVGGGVIYELFLPYVSKMHITEIDDICINADTFFPEFNKNDWNKEEGEMLSEDGITYKHTLYLRK